MITDQCIDKALEKYKERFGFSFTDLLANPRKYQPKIRAMEDRSNLNPALIADTVYYQKIYEERE